jgi:hypothetical protein
MAIVLRGPTQRTRFEFEVTADDRIQIRSIQEPENPEEDYTLGAPFYYRLEAIRELYLWLRTIDENDGWVILSTKDEHIPANGNPPIQGSIEAWARPPVNEWYGLTDNLKGRFATFIPPILEYLGLAEVEHNSRNNRMRAI